MEITSFGLEVTADFYGSYLTLCLVAARLFHLSGLDGILKAGAYFWRRRSILTSVQGLDLVIIWLEAFDVSWVALVT